MADGNIRVWEIVKLLPYRMRVRYMSFENYVSGVIVEEVAKLGREIYLDSEHRQFLQLAAFLFNLDDFFRSGTRAARSAASTFETYGFTGFQIGRSFFTVDNEDTLRGEDLANKLQRSIEATRLGREIQNARSLNDLIGRLIREII